MATSDDEAAEGPAKAPLEEKVDIKSAGAGTSPLPTPVIPVAQTSPCAFTKDVNDYLNHYITLADAKAGAVLAADIAIGAALLDRPPTTDPYFLFIASIALIGLSAVVCTVVVFPRLPSGGKGLIFWEDIRTRSTPDVFANEVRQADNSTIEREYAFQNWYVSGVLHKKHRWVRWAIGLFLAGVAVAALWSLSARWYA